VEIDMTSTESGLNYSKDTELNHEDGVIMKILSLTMRTEL